MRKVGNLGRNKGFTLIELLVVIAIISILAAMMLPALKEVKSKAQRATCSNRIRQVFLGHTLYMNDWKNWLPRADGGATSYRYSNYADAGLREVWLSYWSSGIRYCPTVSSYCNGGSGALNWGPKHQYDESQLHWGYYQPLQDNNFVSRCMYGAASDGFVRPYRKGPTRYVNSPPNGYTSWDDRTPDTLELLPLITDYNFKMRNASPYPFMVSHSGGAGKQESTQSRLDWAGIFPRGSNSVWRDGHVEWNAWTGYVRAFRAVATGRNPISDDPGWAWAMPDAATSVWTWAKKSKKVYLTENLPSI